MSVYKKNQRKRTKAEKKIKLNDENKDKVQQLK